MLCLAGGSDPGALAPHLYALKMNGPRSLGELVDPTFVWLICAVLAVVTQTITKCCPNQIGTRGTRTNTQP